MKLTDRERVEGTRITIGRRVIRRDGQLKASRRYVAEYRDLSGKQVCESLRVSNRVLARRRALELQQRLERGEVPSVPATLTIEELIERYSEYVRLKQAAPKTLSKYAADLAKLTGFSCEERLVRASAFDEDAFLRFRAWLQERGYAPKTIYGALTLAKQALKWAWRKKFIPTYPLADASLPKAKARPQACFTSEQVDDLIATAAGFADGEESLAFALMGYAGLRIGEVEQLRCGDMVRDSEGRPTMLHIRRGGSNGTTKDKDERFIPVHPKIAALLPEPGRRSSANAAAEGRVCTTISERKLLARLKALCKKLGLPKPQQYKLHSFRHHFASLCANHGVAYRKALAWLGHSSSEMLDLYYHLHDADSQEAMRALAGRPAAAGPLNAEVPQEACGPADNGHGGTKQSPTEAAPCGASPEGTLKTLGQSRIETLAETPEFQALAAALSDQTERGGFNLPRMCKLCRNLALSPNLRTDKDFDRLNDILFLHDFLLSRELG